MSNPKKKRSFDDVEPASSDEVTHFTLPSRKNDFSDRTWWMVDIEGYDSNQGATGLVKRCMREYGWDLDKAKRILNAYRQFLTLKKELRDWNATILSPSHLVDQMWHQHILDISNYYHDMVMLCSQIVLHNPDGALGWEEKKSRDERTWSELIKKFGSDNVDREMWGYPTTTMSGSSTESSGDEVGLITPPPAKSVTCESSVESTNEHLSDMAITISVKEAFDGKIQETYFRIQMTTALGNLFKVYALHTRRSVADLRFLRRGARIADHETPAMLEMEDGDDIDCVLGQSGC